MDIGVAPTWACCAREAMVLVWLPKNWPNWLEDWAGGLTTPAMGPPFCWATKFMPLLEDPPKMALGCAAEGAGAMAPAEACWRNCWMLVVLLLALTLTLSCEPWFWASLGPPAMPLSDDMPLTLWLSMMLMLCCSELLLPLPLAARTNRSSGKLVVLLGNAVVEAACCCACWTASDVGALLLLS